MTSTAVLNHWNVARMLVTELEETGYFANPANASRRKSIFLKLAKWSEVNRKVYGTYELYQDQISSSLEAAADDSQLSDAMRVLVENEMVTLNVDKAGNFVLKLQPFTSN